MAKRNRYSGILQTRMVGKGLPEGAVLVLYDIENDRVRTRVANACVDYGLQRIQFSAFLGKLDRNRREELCLRLQFEIDSHFAKVRVIPLCEPDLRATWILEQSCLGEEAAAKKADVPQLRVIRAD